MGNKHSTGRHISPHLIQIPLHIECKGKPEFNVSTKFPFMYKRSSRLFDLFKNVNEYIQDLHKIDTFEINEIKQNSFLGLHIDKIEKSNYWKSSQHKSITMFSQKDIQQKGLHIIIEESDTQKKIPLQNITHKMNKMNKMNQINKNNRPDEHISDEIDTKKKKEATATAEKELNISALMKIDLAYENFNDIMKCLFKKDNELYLFIDQNYMENIQKNYLKWNYRNILIDWLFDLQQDYNLNCATIYTSMNYIDCFLSKRKLFQKNNLQLLGISSLMIACKTLEITPLWMSDYLEISENLFKDNEILNMEKLILDILDWNTFQVTPCDFVDCWLQILNIQNKKYKHCVEFICASCSIYGKKYVKILKSKLVASSIYLSSIYLNIQINLKLLSEISGFTDLNQNDKDIIDLHQIIILLINSNELKHKSSASLLSAIYSIYSKRINHCITQLPFKQLFDDHLKMVFGNEI